MNQRFYRAKDAAVSADPVGFITLPVGGATSAAARAFSYLGISLLNPVSYQGTVTSTGNSVTDDKADWIAIRRRVLLHRKPDHGQYQTKLEPRLVKQ